jgi:hypothetical protein
VQSNVAFDLKQIGFYDDLLNKIKLEILRHAKTHDANSLHLLACWIRRAKPAAVISGSRI